jgi:triosephosphate isomerase (TIM)
MAKKKLVIANWKLYIEKPDEAKRFVGRLRRRRLSGGVEVVVAPSYPLIPATAAALKGSKIKIGAQSVSEFEGGAHTGEVSAAALKNCGVSYAIVGHSERRAQGESEETVKKQLARAREAKLVPVLCVGERERDPGGAYLSFIENQLRAALTGSGRGALVVAYEPVWAIGKTAAEAMKPAEVREMSIFIRKTLVGLLPRAEALKVPILYGGSVEPANAAALAAEAEVDGFLVGHESAVVEAFSVIINAWS